MRGASLFGPFGAAAQDPRLAAPCHRHAVEEFRLVFLMEHAALLQGFLEPLFRRHARQHVSAEPERIAAQHHSRTLAEKAVRRVRNQADRLVGEAVPTIDMILLLPEPALHLEPELDRRVVGQRLDRGLLRVRDLDRDLREDAGRDRADHEVGGGGAGLPGLGIGPLGGDALVVLGDLGHLRVEADQVADLLGEGITDPAHPALGLEHGLLHHVFEVEADLVPHLAVEHI